MADKTASTVQEVLILRHTKVDGTKSSLKFVFEENKQSLNGIISEALVSHFQKDNQGFSLESNETEVFLLKILKSMRILGWDVLTSNSHKLDYSNNSSAVESTFFLEKNCRPAPSNNNISSENCLYCKQKSLELSIPKVVASPASGGEPYVYSPSTYSPSPVNSAQQGLLMRRQSASRDKLMQKYNQHRKSIILSRPVCTSVPPGRNLFEMQSQQQSQDSEENNKSRVGSISNNVVVDNSNSNSYASNSADNRTVRPSERLFERYQSSKRLFTPGFTGCAAVAASAANTNGPLTPSAILTVAEKIALLDANIVPLTAMSSLTTTVSSSETAVLPVPSIAAVSAVTAAASTKALTAVSDQQDQFRKAAVVATSAPTTTVNSSSSNSNRAIMSPPLALNSNISIENNSQVAATAVPVSLSSPVPMKSIASLTTTSVANTTSDGFVTPNYKVPQTSATISAVATPVAAAAVATTIATSTAPAGNIAVANGSNSSKTSVTDVDNNSNSNNNGSTVVNNSNGTNSGSNHVELDEGRIKGGSNPLSGVKRAVAGGSSGADANFVVTPEMLKERRALSSNGSETTPARSSSVDAHETDKVSHYSKLGSAFFSGNALGSGARRSGAPGGRGAGAGNNSSNSSSAGGNAAVWTSPNGSSSSK